MMCDISVLYYFVRGTYIKVSFINKLGRGWGIHFPPPCTVTFFPVTVQWKQSCSKQQATPASNQDQTEHAWTPSAVLSDCRRSHRQKGQRAAPTPLVGQGAWLLGAQERCSRRQCCLGKDRASLQSPFQAELPAGQSP